jgi:hypothetical protein
VAGVCGETWLSSNLQSADRERPRGVPCETRMPFCGEIRRISARVLLSAGELADHRRSPSSSWCLRND